MKHSIFDRIYLSFLLILIFSFGILITFTTISTKRTLTSEKEHTMYKEGEFIINNFIQSYLNGQITDEQLTYDFHIFANTFNSDKDNDLKILFTIVDINDEYIILGIW